MILAIRGQGAKLWTRRSSTCQGRPSSPDLRPPSVVPTISHFTGCSRHHLRLQRPTSVGYRALADERICRVSGLRRPGGGGTLRVHAGDRPVGPQHRRGRRRYAGARPCCPPGTPRSPRAPHREGSYPRHARRRAQLVGLVWCRRAPRGGPVAGFRAEGLKGREVAPAALLRVLELQY